MHRFTIAGLLAALFALPVRAGLYSPDEPFIFEINSDGFATPVQFAGGFDIMIVSKREVGRLIVSARQSGNQIILEVADDGRGA